MKHEEHDLQVSCIKLFISIPKYRGLTMFAIPNGGHRNLITAKKLKSEGVMPGVSDLFLAWPTQKYSGLFIEMKSLKGILSENQRMFIKNIMDAGYCAVVCKSQHEFLTSIDNYLEGKL